MKISMDKRYLCRSGAAVKLLMVDGGGEFPVIGAVQTFNGTWSETAWDSQGRFLGDERQSRFDLVEAQAGQKTAA